VEFFAFVFFWFDFRVFLLVPRSGEHASFASVAFGFFPVRTCFVLFILLVVFQGLRKSSDLLVLFVDLFLFSFFDGLKFSKSQDFWIIFGFDLTSLSCFLILVLNSLFNLLKYFDSNLRLFLNKTISSSL
jgi:hypothetical protein